MKPSISQTVRQIHEVITEHQRAHLLYRQTNFSEYELSFEFVQQLFPSWVVMLCSIYNEALPIPYISENCQKVFGYTAQQMRTMTMEEEYARVHPDDQPPLARIMQRLFAVTKTLSYDTLADYRYAINYRFCRADGHYIHLHDEKLALRNKEGQNLYITLYRDISDEKPFVQAKVEIFRLAQGTYRKTEEYVPKLAQPVITRREQEILQLIQHGQSNKEIADRLYISEHTARNHRSHLFEKANARNAVELLNHARAMQWI